MSSPAPICVACQVEMRCAKNAVVVKDQESGPFPSTYWKGDMYVCPVCNTQIITGFSQSIRAQQAESQGIAKGALEFHHNPVIPARATPADE